MKKPSTAFYLIIILLVALILRLMLWAQPLHQLANDELEYVRVATDLLAGRGWSFYEHYAWLRAPLYPLFLAGSLWLTGDLHLAALPNLLLSVGNVGLIAALAQHLAGRRAALIAASIMALLWTNVTFASLYMLETLFTFLFCSALLVLIRRPLTIRSAMISGILFGLSALTRSAVLPFLGLVFVMMVLRIPQRRQGAKAGNGSKNRSYRHLGALVSWWFGTLHAFQTASKRHQDPKAGKGSKKRTNSNYGVFASLRFSSFQTASKRLIPALAFALSIGLVIAPWTLRNLQAYGRPILIETGLSYNLWAFNEPRESLDEIQVSLERIPNPAERSDYASARGLQRLREDPQILLRKLWPNWVFLARVKPIQDRFLQESYYASIDLPLFSAALIFDDLLYVLIVLAAIRGWGFRVWGLGVGNETPDTRHQTPDTRHQTPDTRHQTQDTRQEKVGLEQNSGAVPNNKALYPFQPGAGRRFCASIFNIWILTVILTILLTHGEARYRHFLFPVLIPYAAMRLGSGVKGQGSGKRETKQGKEREATEPDDEVTKSAKQKKDEMGNSQSSRPDADIFKRHDQRHRPDTTSMWHHKLSRPPETQNSFAIQHSAFNILLSLVFLWTVLTAYPYEWASQNLSRGWYTMQGDLARLAGQPQAAISAYRQASNAQRAADPRLRLGDTARALGDTALAQEAYQSARRISPLYEASAAKLGDLLRSQGNDTAARAAFNADYVDQQRLLDYSWRELKPQPRSFIDIGGGLDYGYITGVYQAEQQGQLNLRWTGPQAQLRINTPTAQQIRLRIAAPRPDGKIVPVVICIASRCTTAIVNNEWHIIHMQLPNQPDIGPIEIRSPIYTAADGRELGVILDWVAVDR